MHDRAKVTAEWLEKRKHDLEGARLLFREGHYTDTIAMLIQQATEKYLKGFLLYHGWKLEKIHDLVKLLSEATRYRPDLADFEEGCRKISEYYFESRYPGRMPIEYSRKEIEESLTLAEQITTKIEKSINL